MKVTFSESAVAIVVGGIGGATCIIVDSEPKIKHKKIQMSFLEHNFDTK